MLTEQHKLAIKIQSIEQQLDTFPEGKLLCNRNGKHYKWYQSNGHTRIYIPKRDRSLAEQLAIKKYLTQVLKSLKKEHRAIQYYLDHHANYHDTDAFLDSTSNYYELLSPYFTPISKELSDWANEPYDTLTQYSEQQNIKTIAGTYVRSKSEAMIDMLLRTNKIPFRYECALQLGELTIHPDFTIRHPNTGETFYWEHFGLMDNECYVQNTYAKLQEYTDHGIIPSIQLITTFETADHPLSMDIIEHLIDYYLL